MGLQNVAFNFIIKRGGKLTKIPQRTYPQKLFTTPKTLKSDVVEFSSTGNKNLKEYIRNSEYLEIYTTPSYPYLDNWGKVNNKLSPEFIEKNKFLESLSPEKIIEYENVIKEILAKNNKSAKGIVLGIKDKDIHDISYDSIIEMGRVKNMLDLYMENPESYRFVLNSDFWFEGFKATIGRGGGSLHGCLKNLSVDTLKELEKIKIKPKVNCGDILEYYIINSHKIYNGDLQKRLHKIIAQKVLSQDITALRAERSVGCFSEMNTSPKLQKRLKVLNRLLMLKTKKANMFSYRKNYMSPVNKGENMYDYIKNAKTLTLADAMEMCRFVDKRTQDLILSELNGVTFVDSRFKSHSLAEDFIEKWVKDDYYGNAKIVNRTKIKKGTEAIFIDDLNNPNGQYEILVNNNLSRTTVNGIHFDRKRNVFYIDSTLESI